MSARPEPAGTGLTGPSAAALDMANTAGPGLQPGRRHALQALASLPLGLAGALASQPALSRPGLASDFASAAASQALLTPFKGVTDAGGDLDCAQLATRGRWPAALAGRFYRNGPALYGRGGQRYHHWFDGDGMVQQFTLNGVAVAHRGRLVRTAKLHAEQQAGRFLFDAFGSTMDRPLPISGPNSINVANTNPNAIEHAGRLLAMWEGGSAHAMSPGDLSTQGPITWRDDLRGVPFSAHPKLDASGHLWNFGTSGAQLVVWHIDPQGRLVDARVAESPFPGGMVHDMAVTARHLVIPLPPIKLLFGQPSEGPRHFEMQAGQPLRILVIDKADISLRRVFELPPQLVFHVGNAFETQGGQISLSFVGAPTPWFLNEGAVAPMQGQLGGTGPSFTQQVPLDLATGRSQLQAFDDQVEFPWVHPQRIGQANRWLLRAASWGTDTGSGTGTGAGAGTGKTSARGAALLHGLQLRDLSTGRLRRHDYGDQTVVEEHVWVPKPVRSGELDAWPLGTTFDAHHQATVLNLLDAAHLEDGPIAQAQLPYVPPLGFHGNFTPA